MGKTSCFFKEFYANLKFSWQSIIFMILPSLYFCIVTKLIKLLLFTLLSWDIVERKMKLKEFEFVKKYFAIWTKKFGKPQKMMITLGKLLPTWSASGCHFGGLLALEMGMYSSLLKLKLKLHIKTIIKTAIKIGFKFKYSTDWH